MSTKPTPKADTCAIKLIAQGQCRAYHADQFGNADTCTVNLTVQCQLALTTDGAGPLADAQPETQVFQIDLLRWDKPAASTGPSVISTQQIEAAREKRLAGQLARLRQHQALSQPTPDPLPAEKATSLPLQSPQTATSPTATPPTGSRHQAPPISPALPGVGQPHPTAAGRSAADGERSAAALQQARRRRSAEIESRVKQQIAAQQQATFALLQQPNGVHVWAARRTAGFLAGARGPILSSRRGFFGLVARAVSPAALRLVRLEVRWRGLTQCGAVAAVYQKRMAWMRLVSWQWKNAFVLSSEEAGVTVAKKDKS